MVEPEKKGRARIPAKKVEIDGEKYDSKSEADFGLVLEAKKRSGEISWYAHHPDPILLAKCGPSRLEQWWYQPDYVVASVSNGWAYYDVKGRGNHDPELRRRMRHIAIIWRSTRPEPLIFVDSSGKEIDLFTRKKPRRVE